METYRIGSMSDVAAYFGGHSVIGPLLMRWYRAARTYAKTLNDGAAGIVDRLFALEEAKAACLTETSHYGSCGTVDVSAAAALALDEETLPELEAVLEHTRMLVGYDLTHLHDVLHSHVPAEQVAVVFLPPSMDVAAITAALIKQLGKQANPGSPVYEDMRERVAALIDDGQLVLGVTHFDADQRREHEARWNKGRWQVIQRRDNLAE